MTQVARAFAAAALVTLVGCGGGNEGRPAEGTETAAAAAPADTAVATELAVEAVMIGKRIGQNNLIIEPTFQFAPNDTVYISVSTTGPVDSGSALSTKWRLQTGQIVDSSSKNIQPEAEGATEFHVVRPKGWPIGTHAVTVYLDGDSVDTKAFQVKK